MRGHRYKPVEWHAKMDGWAWLHVGILLLSLYAFLVVSRPIVVVVEQARTHNPAARPPACPTARPRYLGGAAAAAAAGCPRP